MTPLDELRRALHGGAHRFADTLAFIAAHYDYRPSAFHNGALYNAAGQNRAPAGFSPWRNWKA